MDRDWCGLVPIHATTPQFDPAFFNPVIIDTNVSVANDNDCKRFCCQAWTRCLCLPAALSVSNSLSGRHWELDQVPAVGDPTDIVQLGTGHRVAVGEGQRRVALQRRVAAHLVVGGLEVGKFPFKITGIPEQHMVETFWRCCTNRHWPARCQPTGFSPADAIRHWSAEGGHPIEDLTAEDDLTPLPGWAPGAKTISDDGFLSEERILHPALTMVP